MSGVSASERKSQTDEVRNVREESQNRETEEAKRHRKEVQRLMKAQDKEVAELKEAYDNKLNSLRSKSSEVMTEKDLANQAKIEKLRSLYTDSLKKKTEEHDSRRMAEVEAYENKLSQIKQTTGMQRENLERKFTDSLKDRDRQFEDLSKRSIRETQDAIQTRAEKLNEKHNREMEYMREDRDNSNLQNSRDIQETRSALGGELKDTKRKAERDLSENDRNWRAIYDTKMGEVDQVMGDKNQGLIDAGHKLQNRFRKALDSKLGELDQARETLKDQSSERINRDVKTLESENRILKNNQMSELNKNRSQNNREKDHLVEAYEERMGKLSESKDGLVERTKEVANERVKESNRKNENIMLEVVSRSKSNQIIADERHKDDRSNLEIQQKAELERIGNKTDERYKKVLRGANESQKIQEKMRTENLAVLKDSYSNELSNQRQVQMEIMRDSRSEMDNKMKNTQNKFATKLDETVNSYQNQIKDLEDKKLKALNNQAKAFEQRMSGLEKQHQNEVKSQEIKTDMRLGQQQQIHEKEIDRLERRHQEQMAALATKLNYYRKG